MRTRSSSISPAPSLAEPQKHNMPRNADRAFYKDLATRYGFYTTPVGSDFSRASGKELDNQPQPIIFDPHCPKPNDKTKKI